MKESVYFAETKKADNQADHPAYWSGYRHGLDRRYNARPLNTPESVYVDEWSIKNFQKGVIDGYYGPCDWRDPAKAIKILRQWNDWNTAELAERIGVSARTVEGYEQGRPASAPIIRLLKQAQIEGGKK